MFADIGNISTLGEGDKLLRGTGLQEFKTRRCYIGGTAIVVHIDTDDVYIVVARVPTVAVAVGLIPSSSLSPHPNEVIQFVVVDQAVVHHAPELVACCWIASPPEPHTASLVKGAPQHRYLPVLQQFQVRCHLVDIPNHLLVFARCRFEDLADIKLCLIRVSAVVKSILPIGVGRHVPMPHDEDESTLFMPVNNLTDVRIVNPSSA